MGLPLWAWIEKIIQEVDIYRLSGAMVSKEGHADILLGHKGRVTIDFFEKDATVNSVTYYHLLNHVHLIYWMTLVYIYICIYIYIYMCVCVWVCVCVLHQD